MLDQTFLRRLVLVLRMGSSDQVHEADTAFRKALAMMEERGVTLDMLFRAISPGDLPQSVCAEIARRYCLSRPDLGPSAREDAYKAAFLEIVRIYSPEIVSPTSRSHENPSSEAPQRRTSKTSSGDTGRESSEHRSEAPPKSDWKSRMDETRRWAQRDSSDHGARSSNAHTNASWNPDDFFRSASEPSGGFFIFKTDFSQPIFCAKLLFLCVLYGLPRGFLLALVIAGVCREYDIHTFDRVSWEMMLLVCAFPFLVWKWRGMVSRGHFFS